VPWNEFLGLLLRVVSRELSRLLPLLSFLLLLEVSVTLSVVIPTLDKFVLLICEAWEFGGIVLVASETFSVDFLRYEGLDARVKKEAGAMFFVSFEPHDGSEMEEEVLCFGLR